MKTSRQRVAASSLAMKITALCTSFIILFLSLSSSAQAAVPWPGEAWSSAVNLSGLDSEFSEDLSGAHWNPETRTLWVCQNGVDKVWTLVEDGAGNLKINDDGFYHEWDLGNMDLEGITQAALDQDVIYALDENGYVRSYDLSNQNVVSLHAWDIRAYLNSIGGSGPEGITFVPDGWLQAQGFVDGEGAPYVSQLGMQGLIFVGHQNGGQVYVFDLDPAADNTLSFVGKFRTSRDETAGLEFDRSNGWLYVWHNIGSNYLEITDLTSAPAGADERVFNSVIEYVGPTTGNLEGFALAPQSSEDRWCFITRDDGGSDSLRWFQSFVPLTDTTPSNATYLPLVARQWAD